MRIVSLLPSATEIVYALGLGDHLYGVTHGCDFPPEAKEKPVVVRSRVEPEGSTSGEIDAAVREYASSGAPIYQIDLKALSQAQPDLILTQGLCEVCAVPAEQVTEAIEGLSTNPQVVSLDPHSLNDLFNDILKVGEATNTTEKAQTLISSFERRRDEVAATAAIAVTRPRVACLEWLDPLLVAGHWMPEMVELAGGENCFGEKGQPSFKIEWQQVMEARPEVVIAMPCGFDVRKGIAEVHLLTEKEGWESLPAAVNERLFVVDGGAYFSRSGPRLVDGLEMMAEILHPELFSGMVPQGGASRIYGQLFKVS